MAIRLRAVARDDVADLRAMAEAFDGENGHPIDAKAKAAALILALGDGDTRA